MNLHNFMCSYEVKNDKKTQITCLNNTFLMLLSYVLCENTFVGYSKMKKNANNLFKQLSLLHLHDILCKIIIVECSY
jgi:hypothetical protein